MSAILGALVAAGRTSLNAGLGANLLRVRFEPQCLRYASSLPSHVVLGMPALSPTMSQGNVAKWHVEVGDAVRAGSVLADVETDKATLAFENQDDGFVAKLLVPDGAKDVPVGQPILVICEEAADIPAFANYTAAGGAGAGAAAAVPKATAAAASKPAAAPAKQAAAVQVNHRLGPAVRKLLQEAGLSPSDISPTGPNGIVTKGDVLAAVASGVKPGKTAAPAVAPAKAAAAAAPPAPAAPALAAAPKPATPAPAAKPSTAGKAPSFTDIPNTQIRKVIASRLLESKVTIPGLYVAADTELDALLRLRKSLLEQGMKLSVNDFVLKAVGAALKAVPAANAVWDAKKGEGVVVLGVDISVAVATERGLITPIVKDAANKSVGQISKDVKALAQKAKDNKLKPEEFMGGSFTVSNLGMFGISHFSAIINPPQGAILAVGSSQPKVVLVDGKPVTKTIMTVTLSADHRIYDGELAASFLNAFKAAIEAPANLLM